MQKLLFEETICEHRLDEAMRGCGTVIVGYSGGADSSCLLHLLSEWCRRNGVKLYAAHVNHMIRGEEADRDQKFCEETCKKLGVPIEVVRVDVPQIAKQFGLGIEEAARTVRYDVFDSLSEKLTGKKNGAIIATAHNASDNLETVIFNMLRGTGLHGLCGIDPVRDGRFIRPLIYDSGEQIRVWCDENKVNYIIDSTNSETEYTRNRIRHNIVPEMRKITHNPENAISRMTTLLRSDDDCLNKIADSLVSENATSVSKEVFQGLHPAIASRIIRKLYKNAKKDSSNLGEVHVRSVLDLIESGEGESKLSLPGKTVAVINRNIVSFVLEEKLPSTPQTSSFIYPDDGEIFKNELCKVTFSHTKHNHHNINFNKDENIYKLSIPTSLSFDKIKGSLKVRYRIDGDTYRYGGMTRKVKKLFGDKKISAFERALTPILYDDDGIVWIPGFPPRDGMKYDGIGDPIYVTCDFFDNNNIR